MKSRIEVAGKSEVYFYFFCLLDLLQLLGRAVQVLVKMAVPVQMLAAQTSLVIARMTTMTATPVLNVSETAR